MLSFFKNLFGKKTNNLENSVKLEATPKKEVKKYIRKKTIKISPVKNNSTLSKEELIEMLAKGELKNNKSLEILEKDPFLKEAIRLVVSHQQVSNEFIQKRLKLGNNGANRIIDQLEKEGIIGTFEKRSNREVLVQNFEDLENYFKTGILIIDFEQFLEENKQQIEERKIELEKEEIKKTILEKNKKRQIIKDAFKELVDEGLLNNNFSQEGERREIIPQDVMDKVWNRDGGKCVQCGSQEHLEFDHIIPFSKGGATTYRNLQILCKKCNIEKSNKIG